MVLPALLKSSNRPNILYATSKDFMYTLNAITNLEVSQSYEGLFQPDCFQLHRLIRFYLELRWIIMCNVHKYCMCHCLFQRFYSATKKGAHWVSSIAVYVTPKIIWRRGAQALYKSKKYIYIYISWILREISKTGKMPIFLIVIRYFLMDIIFSSFLIFLLLLPALCGHYVLYITNSWFIKMEEKFPLVL